MKQPAGSTRDRIVIRASSLPGYTGGCQLRTAVHAMPALFKDAGFHLRPPTTNVGALIGTACHSAAEHGLTEVMLKGAHTPGDVLEDIAVASLYAREGEERDDGAIEVIMDEEASTMPDAERQARRMSLRYDRDVTRQVEVLSVESRIEATVRVKTGADPEVVLSGQLDVLAITRTEQDRRNTLRDQKTSRRAVKGIQHAAQQGCYSLLEAGQGFTVDQVVIDKLRRVKLSEAQPAVEPEVLDVQACEEIAWTAVNEFADKAVAFVKDGNPSRFLPNAASFLCNMMHCRAFGQPVCPATRYLALVQRRR